MEEFEHLTAITDSLLTCCFCKRLVQDAVQLTCLHNCCRQCFDKAASCGFNQAVLCGTCCTISQARTEQPNSFIDSQVRYYSAIADSRWCFVCKGNGEPDKSALMWCSACGHSLCGDCIIGHRQYYRQHVTTSLEDLGSLDEARSHPSTSNCTLHRKPMEIACLNCQQPKCISCWAKCNENKHESHIVGDKFFDNYIGEFISLISSLERELLSKSGFLEKPKSSLGELKSIRTLHLEQINQRKRRIADALDLAYHEVERLTKNAYDELEREHETAAAAADCLALKLVDARSYARRLIKSSSKCDILSQQKIVRQRLGALSAELDAMSQTLDTTIKTVNIHPSLPEDVVNIVKEWIGVPLIHSVVAPLPPRQLQQQQCSFTFDEFPAIVQLPVRCYDVSLTQNGRLLLAAEWHGLIECCSSSERELSRWRPPQLNGGEDDGVIAAAALCDGRVAVSLLRRQLVMLLRRSEGDGMAAVPATIVWTEDSRLDQLQWSPCRLAVHGDVLAMSEDRFDRRLNVDWLQNTWLPGSRLQLQSLNSGRPLTDELRRDYDILSLAVSARAVVTLSCGKVERSGGGWASQVLDAHSIANGDERLWRREFIIDDGESLHGLCADSIGCCLYAAAWRSDLSSGRVTAISLTDGSELRRAALSFDGLEPWLPLWLSLSDFGESTTQQQGTTISSIQCRLLHLAVLCWHPTNSQLRMVTVHSRKEEEP